MKNDTPKNDWPEVATPDQPEQVKRSGWTSSLQFIVADDRQQDKRRAEALAGAYRYILSDAWGSHE